MEHKVCDGLFYSDCTNAIQWGKGSYLTNGSRTTGSLWYMGKHKPWSWTYKVLQITQNQSHAYT